MTANSISRGQGSSWNYPFFVLVLLPLGLLTANLSPVAVAISDGPLRQAVLALGTMFIATLGFLLFVRPPSRKSLGKLVMMGVVIGILEVLNFLNSSGGEDLAVALVMRCLVYLYLVIGFALAASMPNQPVRFPVSVEWLCIVMALIASLVWLRFYSSASATGSRFRGSEDLHPVGLGLTFGICTTVCMGILFMSTSKLVKAASLPALVGLLLCVLSTGSRGTLMALLAVLVVAVSTQVKSFKGWVATAIAITLALAVGLAATVFVPQVRDQLDFVVERFLHGLDGDMDTSQLERKLNRQYYLSRIDEWALKGDPRYDSEAYPHNVFLELVIRFGFIVGGAISVALVACVLRAGYWMTLRSKRTDAVCFVVTLLGLYSFVLCQMNLALEFNRAMWIFVGYWLVRPSEAESQV